MARSTKKIQIAAVIERREHRLRPIGFILLHED